MGKISQKKLKSYYRIYEQIYENPLISLYDIAVNTGLARGSVTRYAKEMYEKGIICGPRMCMKSARNYNEYVYLVNFRDPLTANTILKGFPQAVYTGLTFGDWNTLVITSKLLDFAEIEGFENVVHHSTKYCTYTPKVEYIQWDQSFEMVYDYIDQFMPYRSESKKREITSLPWGDNEWELYHAFNFMRQKITPLLRKIDVSYPKYVKWMKSLHNYCTIHTGFYPDGYEDYLSCCFLFDTDYEESVKFIFSLFPTTSFVTELDNFLLVFAHVIPPTVKMNLICLVYDMETKKMIKGFKEATLYTDCRIRI